MNETVTHVADCPSRARGAEERERLLRYCAVLTGSREVAEDLVQETLLEAWRHEDSLRDPERRVAWLFGIARNVFLRWSRRPSRDVLTRSAPLPDTVMDSSADIVSTLERRELEDLLDRALGMLPESARQVLVERYIDDLPQSEIARNLGTTEGAVAVRLHRGRQALRRLLLDELRPEAVAYGLQPDPETEWESTPLWCSTCGLAKVVAFRDVNAGVFLVHCPHCRSSTSDRTASYLREVQGFTRTMITLMRSARTLYLTALIEGSAPCPYCREPVSLRRGLPGEYAGSTDPDLGVQLDCRRCGALSHQPVYGIALSLPQAERFWRKNRRMRTRKVQHIRAHDRPALLVRFESVTTNDALEVLLDRETLLPVETFTNGKELP